MLYVPHINQESYDDDDRTKKEEERVMIYVIYVQANSELLSRKGIILFHIIN